VLQSTNFSATTRYEKKFTTLCMRVHPFLHRLSEKEVHPHGAHAGAPFLRTVTCPTVNVFGQCPMPHWQRVKKCVPLHVPHAGAPTFWIMCAKMGAPAWCTCASTLFAHKDMSYCQRFWTMSRATLATCQKMVCPCIFSHSDMSHCQLFWTMSHVTLSMWQKLCALSCATCRWTCF
jgi:hypothetical protein